MSSVPVKVPTGQSFGMTKGAKFIYPLTNSQWVEMEVTEDVAGAPFKITERKVSNVMYQESDGYGSTAIYEPSKEGISG